MKMKNKLYLRIILLINYIMEENLFDNVQQSPVKHAASWFSVRKKCHKKTKTKKSKTKQNNNKKQKESDTWMD